MAKRQPFVQFRRKVRTRRQWDRFCLWVAVGGGSLAGLMFVLPDLSVALGAQPWSVAWHHGLLPLNNFVLMYTIAVLEVISKHC